MKEILMEGRLGGSSDELGSDRGGRNGGGSDSNISSINYI